MAEAPDPDATLLQLQNQLQAARNELAEWCATLAHDLRAPLRHMLSYAQLVREDAGDTLAPEVLGYLDTIDEAGRRLGSQLEALMALGRMGTNPVHLQTLDLGTLLASALATCRRQWPQHNVAFTVHATLPPVIGDAQALHGAMLAVLDNAFKFTTPRSAARIDVRWEAGSESGAGVLHIQDNGIGFDPALASRLFKPFSRLHRADAFPGQGMGLVLARKHLQRMNARLELTGQADKGCSAMLHLSCAVG